ncbi:cell division protein FtsQ/DivIB [Aeromicrobium sp. Leaf350]|uniref:cell division protein FtsQ/DivIB n=1 Tax=Aeromicrobium sp. Leaf350 TaxID=2876565 RepID=UPI001E2C34B7|nr:FtsQ-type POTRA domain-containing protein [Aeromicrobium sp. Leaf350]
MSDTRGLFGRSRRQARLHRAVRVLIVLVVLLVLGAGAWVVAFSSLLAADEVEVTGTEQLSEAEVEAAADVPLGRPLARLDLDAIEERVRTLTMVESAEVSRSWPGTVTIRVTERTAVAWIEAQGEIRGVDRFGADFRSFDEPPQLTEIRIETNDPRDRQQSLEGLGSVVSTLREKAPDLLAQVAYGEAESQDSVTLHLLDGRSVRWGSSEDSERKLEVITALLASVQATEYDVSAPEQPTTRE